MTGFPDDTVNFLTDLRANNDKAWFDANRPRYEAAYLAAAATIVEALAPGLDALVPGIHAEAKVLGSIFRINRDTRFSNDKRPYKDHLDLWFWQGDRKSAPSGLFFRVSPDGVVIGAGNHALARDQLQRYRDAVDQSLVELVASLEGAGYEIGGETYTRVPRGHTAGGPFDQLLKHSALHAFADLPPQAATDASLTDVALDHWRQLAPLHRWLTDRLS